MDKEHKHDHSAHEHKAEHTSSGEKILGFGVNIIVLLAVLVIATAIIATIVGYDMGQANANSVISTKPATNTAVIDKVLLKNNVDKFFKDNQLAVFGSATVSLTVKSVEDGNDGLTVVNYSISDGTNTQEGKFLAASANKIYVANAVFDLTQTLPVPTTKPAASTAPVKSDKPKVDLYVMAFCPYGNQAEDTMISAYALLKNTIDFNVHFIVSVSGDTVSSLHGANEVVQDEREACVLKYYGVSKWFQVATYVNTNCGSAQSTSCWADAVTKAGGIDATKIDTCVTSEGVALMKENEAASTAAGANGSPTLLLNGVSSTAVYQYGNSEAYKQAICSSFNTAPSECSTKLSAATTTAQAGSCNPAP